MTRSGHDATASPRASSILRAATGDGLPAFQMFRQESQLQGLRTDVWARLRRQAPGVSILLASLSNPWLLLRAVLATNTQSLQLTGFLNESREQLLLTPSVAIPTLNRPAQYVQTCRATYSDGRNYASFFQDVHQYNLLFVLNRSHEPLASALARERIFFSFPPNCALCAVIWPTSQTVMALSGVSFGCTHLSAHQSRLRMFAPLTDW